MRIGFIGLGIMGKPMVRNLLKAGHQVWVHNRSRAPEEELARDGAVPAPYEALAAQAEVVFTMLPDGPQVEEVLFGDGGLAPHLRRGTVLVDCSSIDPAVSRRLAARLARQGVEMLDAPVSGGEPKAIDGTLSFMVGGKREIFDFCKPVLEAMGASVVHCGDVGAGNTVKLANQIIVAGNIQALAEGLTFAELAGADPQVVFDAIRGGLAGSTVMEAKAPMMLRGDDKPGFRVDLHIKDLRNALNFGREVGAPLPMTEGTMAVLQSLAAAGEGDRDHSAMVHWYQTQTGARRGTE